MDMNKYFTRILMKYTMCITENILTASITRNPSRKVEMMDNM